MSLFGSKSHEEIERANALAEHHARIEAGYENPPDFSDEFPADEADEVLDYMVELLESGEMPADEVRRQLLSVGYDEATIDAAFAECGAL